MFKSDGSRRDFPLTRDRIIIGRTNEVGLRIPLSSVSRKHCEIAIEGDVVRLRDLGSSNGTLHNSVRVQEAELAAGDRVEVGPVVFIVVIDGVPAEVEKVCSLVEQDLVDTSVGVPVVSEDGSAEGEGEGEAAGKVMEPGPALPAAKPAAARKSDEAESEEEDAQVEVLDELEEQQVAVSVPARRDAPKPKPMMPVAPAAQINEEDALAAAARAAELAVAKPIGPGESFSDGATEIDMEDPIAALERLAAAERAQEDKFSLFAEEAPKASKTRKK